MIRAMPERQRFFFVDPFPKTSFVESKNGDRDSSARRETKVLGSPREQVVSLRYFESRWFVGDILDTKGMFGMKL